MSLKAKAIVVAVICLIITGMVLLVANRSSKKIGWQPADYTMEEIHSKMTDFNMADLEQEDDRSEKALAAYNNMLGYIENELGLDYKVVGCYHYDQRNRYVVKIVLSDYADSFAALAQHDINSPLVCAVDSDENGEDIMCSVQPFLMARLWTRDMTSEFKESFPGYRLNVMDCSLDHAVPRVNDESYGYIDDYTYFFTEDFYSSGAAQKYDNRVNLIVPPGTDRANSAAIFSAVEPLMRKYCVTAVNIVSPLYSDQYMQIMQLEEMTGNDYSKYEGFEGWIESFEIT
ncbi:MAG: hypothetical protein IJ806_00155 [Ruminococcus sp.]|nr:hypothetical protein [Ruminococcus sp.]